MASGEPIVVIDHRSMEVQDPALRARIQELTFALIGRGESLP